MIDVSKALAKALQQVLHERSRIAAKPIEEDPSLDLAELGYGPLMHWRSDNWTLSS